MASTFPNQIDDIPSFLDVTQSDAQLLSTFQTAMRNGDFNTANLTLQQISNYNQKIVSAERLNKLRDAILAIENFYNTTVYPYIENKQTEWQNIINQFSYQGDWNNSTQFLTNNIVKYNINGQDYLFLCLLQNSGQSVTNTTYWRKLTIQGVKGDNNTDTTSFSFEWNPSTTYQPNTIVAYVNAWYVALQTNINSQPSEGSTMWQQVLVFPQPIYPIQSTQPISQQIGELWFEVI